MSALNFCGLFFNRSSPEIAGRSGRDIMLGYLHSEHNISVIKYYLSLYTEDMCCKIKNGEDEDPLCGSEKGEKL